MLFFFGYSIEWLSTYMFVSCRVQLILDRISKGINDKVNGESSFKKAFFKFAYDYKSKWTSRGYSTPLFDA